jgi:hypothetical protein
LGTEDGGNQWCNQLLREAGNWFHFESEKENEGEALLFTIGCFKGVQDLEATRSAMPGARMSRLWGWL